MTIIDDYIRLGVTPNFEDKSNEEALPTLPTLTLFGAPLFCKSSDNASLNDTLHAAIEISNKKLADYSIDIESFINGEMTRKFNKQIELYLIIIAISNEKIEHKEVGTVDIIRHINKKYRKSTVVIANRETCKLLSCPTIVHECVPNDTVILTDITKAYAVTLTKGARCLRDDITNEGFVSFYLERKIKLEIADYGAVKTLRIKQ